MQTEAGRIGIFSGAEDAAEMGKDVALLARTDLPTWGEPQLGALERLDSYFEQSTLLCRVGREVLAGASSSWLEGNSFAGQTMPKVPGAFSSAWEHSLRIS